MTKTIEDALKQLRHDPDHPVRTSVDGMTVEVRVVPSIPADRSAAAAFAAIGPWQGETTEEIMAILADARRQGSSRNVRDL